MPMPGRSYQAGNYRYGFNGQENDNEVKGTGNQLDFGEREYDTRLGRWFTTDKYYYKYRSVSPYAFALNNPICNLDIAGDSVWTETSPPELVQQNGKTVQIVTHTLNLTMKVLDISDQPFNKQEFIDNLKSRITNQLDKKRDIHSTGSDIPIIQKFVIGKIEIEAVSTMDDVKASDHLMVIVDDIDPSFLMSEDFTGLAAPLGKIGYVKNGWLTSSTDAAATGAHEFFHNLGLIDMYKPFMDEMTASSLDPDYKTNYMYSSRSKSPHLTEDQINEMWDKVLNGTANRDENSEIVKTRETNGLTSTSSPKKPYDSSVSKGEKIPRRLNPPNKK